MRGRKIKFAHQDMNLVAVCAEQLTEIKRLQINIDQLIKRLNKPLATAISVTLIPLLLETLFLHQNALFHETYEKFYLENYQILIGRNELVSVKQGIHSLWNSLFPTHGNSEVSLAKFFSKIDEWESRENFQQRIKTIKDIFIDVCNSALRQHGKPLLHKTQRDHYSVKDLFSLIKQYYPDQAKATADQMMTLVSTMERVSIQAVDIINRSAFAALILPIRVLSIMLVNHILVNPLVGRLFPNGIKQNPIPKKDLQGWVSHLDAENFITLLRDHEKKLQSSTKFSGRIQIVLSFLLIPLAVYMLDMDTPSAEILVIALSLIAASFSALKDELIDLYVYYYSLSKDLKDLEKSIKKILDKTGHTSTEIITGNSLEASSIMIRFSNQELLDIFKNCLVCNGITNIIYSRTSITIPANTNFNKKIVSIQEMFEKSQFRIKNIKLLRSQLHEVAQLLCLKSDYDLVPDNKQLPTLNFELEIPATMQNNLITEFKKLAPDWSIITTTTKIIINSYFAIENQKLKDFTYYVRKDLDFNKSKKPLISFSETDKNESKRTFVKEKEQEKTLSKSDKIIEENLKNQLRSDRIIRWSSDTYDSVQENCNIRLFHPRGQVYDKKFLETCNRFTKNEIRRDNFPNDDLYNAVDNVIEKSIEVPDEGNSGLIKETGWERDQDHKWFFYSMKGKLLGHKDGKGDLRFFAEKETNADGISLYRFRGVNFDSH